MASTTLPSGRGGALARPHLAAVARRWPGLGLTGVLLLAAALNVYRLDQEGYANTYYAAAVKSMLSGWHAFFFASFDAGGYVSVDKPPLGLWVQAASAKLFGFSGLSILLPQAVAGVLSVALLYHLVRRAFGVGAGLLAALALAVTPISVVVDRNNTMDSLLVLVLLLAAWAVTVACEAGRLRWLLLGAALVGLGFNIKMFQAFLVLPAFGLMYLLAAPRRWRTRVAHLAAASIVLVVVSLAWAVAVDLTPADQRPYVGSSGTNSVLSLALGYNGLGRVTEAVVSRMGLLSVLGVNLDLQTIPGFAPGIGDPGPLRLLNDGLAGQTSWLLPLAALGLLATVRQVWFDPPPRRKRAAVVLWGGWLIACSGYFSASRFFHLYYLVMLAPAVAALAGIGVATLWRQYTDSARWWWILPAALLATAVVQANILADYPEWDARLSPLILGMTFIAVAVLAAARLGARLPYRVAPGALVAGSLGLLIAPAVWSAVSVRDGNGGAWLPQAGPSQAFGGAGGGPRRVSPQGNGPASPGMSMGRAAPPGGGRGAMTFAGAEWNSLDPQLLAFLQANQGTARYIVATPTSSYASVFILATGQPAMALGGYQGWDQILTPADLDREVADGTVRYFLLTGSQRPAGPGADGGQSATAGLEAWVRESCTSVPASDWQGSQPAVTDDQASEGRRTAPAGDAAVGSAPSGTSGPRAGGGAQAGQQLYDCAPATAAGAGA